MTSCGAGPVPAPGIVSLAAFRCLQVTQKAGQSLLLGVVILPGSEIADVAHLADVGGPGLIALHNGVEAYALWTSTIIALFRTEGGTQVWAKAW